MNFSSKWILIQDTYKNLSFWKATLQEDCFQDIAAKLSKSVEEWREKSPDVRVIHGRDSLAEPHRKYNSLSSESEYITEEEKWPDRKKEGGSGGRGGGQTELEGNPILGELCQRELQYASESFSSRHSYVAF